MASGILKNCLLLTTGVASCISGIYMKGMSVGSYVVEKTYGGDAYTGIQNASATTAENIRYLARIVQEGFALMFFLAGAILIICSIADMVKTSKKEKKNTQYAGAYIPNAPIMQMPAPQPSQPVVPQPSQPVVPQSVQTPFPQNPVVETPPVYNPNN